MESGPVGAPVGLRGRLQRVLLGAALVIFLAMSTESCHGLASERICPRLAISRRQLGIAVGSLGEAMLDVDILKLHHAVGAHGELGPPLIRHQLVILALAARFVWLGGDSKAHEGLWTGHLAV